MHIKALYFWFQDSWQICAVDYNKIVAINLQIWPVK